MTLCSVAIVDGREDPFYFIPVADRDAMTDFMAEEKVELDEVRFHVFERHIDANEFVGGRLAIPRESALTFWAAVHCIEAFIEEARKERERMMREAHYKDFDQHLW